MILAQKYNEDLFLNNIVYSQATGLSMKKIFLLESFLIKKINYKLHVYNYEYAEYHKTINQLSKKQDK